MTSLFFHAAAVRRALVDGADYPTLPATRRAYRVHADQAFARMTSGGPRLRPRTLTLADYEQMTVRQLDALLRARKIPGRSKARRKADKIKLLGRIQ